MIMIKIILIKCHQTSPSTPHDCRSEKSPLLEGTLLVQWDLRKHQLSDLFLNWQLSDIAALAGSCDVDMPEAEKQRASYPVLSDDTYCKVHTTKSIGVVRCGPLDIVGTVLYLLVDYRAFAEETGSSCPDESAVIWKILGTDSCSSEERERKTDRIWICAQRGSRKSLQYHEPTTRFRPSNLALSRDKKEWPDLTYLASRRTTAISHR